jgi:hyperosmotically inducible periplasmic protein
MKVSNVFTALTVAGLLVGAPSAYAAIGRTQTGATAQVSDDQIESRLESLFKKDSILAARDIDVESDHGKVTLTGSVKTADEKARAARLAKIDGVATVVNELEVNANADRSKIDRAAEKTKEGANKAIDATAKGAEKTKEGAEKGVTESGKAVGKAAKKTGEAIGTAGEKVGDASNNAAVTTRVKTAFGKDSLIKETSINVDTKDGVVTLRGTVPSAAAKTKAEEIATSTEGVTRVVNELVVKP